MSSSLLSTDAPTGDLGPRTLAVSITMYVLAFAAVGLRFASRAKSKTAFWWDDWLSFAGLAGCTGILISIILADHHGLGQHWQTVGLPDVGVFLNILYVVELVYVVTLYLLKLSILFFYWRTIQDKRIRLPLYITGGLITAWMFGSAFTSIFQCTPVTAAWDLVLRLGGEATCIDIQTFYLATAIPNIITDVFLLALPIPFTIHHQSTSAQKALYFSFFLIGSFVAICSGLRLRVLSNFPDPFDVTWSFADPVIWSALETNIGTICICLPVLPALFSRFHNADPQSPLQSLGERPTGDFDVLKEAENGGRIETRDGGLEGDASTE